MPRMLSPRTAQEAKPGMVRPDRRPYADWVGWRYRHPSQADMRTKLVLRILMVIASVLAWLPSLAATYEVTAAGVIPSLSPSADTARFATQRTTTAEGQFVLQAAEFTKVSSGSLIGKYGVPDMRQTITVNGESAELVVPGSIFIRGPNAEDTISYQYPPLYFPRNNAVLSLVRYEIVSNRNGTVLFNVIAKIEPYVAPIVSDGAATSVADTSAPLNPKSNGCGCTTWAVSPMTVSLSLHDMPVGYRPPVGPAIELHLTYSQRDDRQGSEFAYFNFGPQWTSNWTGFVFDRTGVAAKASLALRSGGGEDFEFASTSALQSKPSPFSQSVLVKQVGAGGKTAGFRRLLKDGSAEEYFHGIADQYLLTALVDPAGRRIVLGYDGTHRLVSITDAIGQVTRYAYENADPLKVTRVTDPFGRSARFTYNGAGQLSSITDTIGITSSFTYGNDNFVTALTTPYGTTRFTFADSSTDTTLGTTRYLQVTDALGRISRVEFNQAAPGIADSDPLVPAGMGVTNSGLRQRNTFVWTPKQYAEATRNGGLDYSKAKIIHWLKDANPAVVSRVIESVKEPLQSRVWYRYAGQPDSTTIGSSNQPTQIGRVLSDGRTQLRSFQYNEQGNVTQIVDPLGRRTTLSYDTNGIDLLKVANTTSTEQVLAVYTYNAQHLPRTARGANGLTTQFEYNAAGQPTRVTNPRGEVTIYSYDPAGFLQRIEGPLAGATVAFTYDAVGRVETTTSPGGSRVTYAYDNADRPTTVSYPDRTTLVYAYKLLDLESITNRLGRKTSFGYDAERQLTRTTDALSQSVEMDYSPGGTLTSLTDQRRNTTRWEVDLQDRVTDKIYADGTTHATQYDPANGLVTLVIDAAKQRTATQYNLDDTVAAVGYANTLNPTAGVSYRYDPIHRRLVSMTDGVGTTSYDYYRVGELGANQLRTITSPIAGGSGSDTVTYGYDALDRVAERVVNGSRQAISFDALGRVTGVTNALDSFTYGYSDGTARVTSIRSGAGPQVALEYFDATGNELLKRQTYTNTGGTLLSQFAYTFDANYNVKSFTESYANQRLAAALGPGVDGGLAGTLRAFLAATPGADAPDIRGSTFFGVSLSALRFLLLLSIGLAVIGWLLTRGTNRRRWLWPVAPVAMCVVVASCGGGGGTADHPLERSPRMATAEQRATLGLTKPLEKPRARPMASALDAYGGVPADDAVDQLFDKVAEPSFPSLFPGHKTTQRFGAYRFRYYPETGIYVAVAVGVSEGGPLVESGVYVLGGAFGNDPILVGRLLEFITPTATTARAQVTVYGYDAIDRLVSGTVGTDTAPPAGAPKHAYGYDPASNLTAMTVDGAPKALSYSNTNALLSSSYDTNGNPTQQEGWTYSWDANHRLIRAVKGTAESSFIYDGAGRMVRIIDKQSGQVVSDKSYLWCGLERCQERDNTRNGSPVRTLYFAQGTVANGTSLHYVTDHLGSVRQLVSTAGTVQAQYGYDPYGSRTQIGTATAQADAGYTGYYRHTQSGLDFAVYRAYQPQQGRFLNRDPIEEAGGINLYGYVEGNPLSYTDPTGQCPWCIGAALGFSFELVSQLVENGGNWRCVDGGQLLAATALGAVGGGLGGRLLGALGNASATATSGTTKIANVTLKGSRAANWEARIGATEFRSNLLSSGYKEVATRIGSNGPVTVLSNGTKSYTLYTATSTGEASVQVTNAFGQILSKIRLVGS